MLLENGRVEAWGNNDEGQVTVPERLKNVRAVSAGGSHSMALTKTGEVVEWGNGRPDRSSRRCLQCRAADHREDASYCWSCAARLPDEMPRTNVIAIAAEGGHALVLKLDGTVEAWGSNCNSQASVPLGLGRVKAVATGGSHSFALTEDGTVHVWGHFTDFWGDKSETCELDLEHVKAISAGEDFAVALKEDGTVIGCWGDRHASAVEIPEELK